MDTEEIAQANFSWGEARPAPSRSGEAGRPLSPNPTADLAGA
ncbi:hypothetical protein BTZ20_4892 [Rhodococcus sp. MTM3W5.2]|nr:hypothetical protein BTZ20_4892 [Rhodococcus sp. MTM3W5.2]